MTAEQIISIITEHKNFCAICVGEDNREVRRDWQISGEQMPVIANKLLELFKQEKKEMAKDIFKEIDNISGCLTDDNEELEAVWFANEESNHVGSSYLVINTYDFDNIKQKISDKYGVEL